MCTVYIIIPHVHNNNNTTLYQYVAWHPLPRAPRSACVGFGVGPHPAKVPSECLRVEFQTSNCVALVIRECEPPTVAPSPCRRGRVSSIFPERCDFPTASFFQDFSQCTGFFQRCDFPTAAYPPARRPPATRPPTARPCMTSSALDRTWRI